MKIIELSQEEGENELWLAWRKGKLTASTSAPIMGIYTYKTPYMLWESLLGLAFPEVMNSDMQRGKEMESEARDSFNAVDGTDFKAVCVEHMEHSHLVASLDGINESKTVILELKCPNPARPNHLSKHFTSAEDFKNAKPDYYHQVQWQLMCCNENVTHCCFATFWRDKIDSIVIPRDNKYIAECEKKAVKWYQDHIIEKKEPKKIKVTGCPYNQGDFVYLDSIDSVIAARALREVELRRKSRAKEEKKDKALSDTFKAVLAEESDDLDFICDKIAMTRVNKRNIDTKRLYLDYNITDKMLEKYKVDGIGYWKVSLT